MTDLDTAEPLTDWLQGTLTLVFSHGARVSRHVPLSTAIEVRQVAAGVREPDGLSWHETGWLQFAAEKVVFIDFVLDEGGGWTLSAAERRTLDSTPYRRGVLVALRDYWGGQSGPEVAYSARALVALHRQALANPSPEAWARAARSVEGEAGAERIRQVHDEMVREQAAAQAQGPADPADPADPTGAALDLTLDSDGEDDLDQYIDHYPGSGARGRADVPPHQGSTDASEVARAEGAATGSPAEHPDDAGDPEDSEEPEDSGGPDAANGPDATRSTDE